MVIREAEVFCVGADIKGMMVSEEASIAERRSKGRLIHGRGTIMDNDSVTTWRKGSRYLKANKKYICIRRT